MIGNFRFVVIAQPKPVVLLAFAQYLAPIGPE